MVEERFWAKVNKNGADGCWGWTAYKNKGYGYIKIDGKMIRAHRYSWELINGPIPDGLMVRHKCRGLCVNPEHLELGTNKENQLDRIRDGTDDRGEKCVSAKLTNAQVLDIRSRVNQTQKSIAKEFNVGKSTINFIINRKRWAHI